MSGSQTRRSPATRGRTSGHFGEAGVDARRGSVRWEAESTNVIYAPKKMPSHYSGPVTASAACAPTPETP